jgi:DNA-binding response OmpR family regulator
MESVDERNSGVAKGTPPLIFLVDDERMLGELAEIILQNEGYQTRFFEDPREALFALERELPKPELLITDYVMGSMDGVELIEACRFVLPGLKTLMVSGTVEESYIKQLPIRPDLFLAKPYVATILAARVRQLLPAAQLNPRRREVPGANDAGL